MSAPLLTLENGIKIIDEAIARKKAIADGLPSQPFTSAENMMVYDCVFKLCTQKPPHDYSDLLYKKVLNCLQERIMEKEIPKFLGRHGVVLLTEVTQSWSEFTNFAESISKFFEYLDRYYIPRRNYPSLFDSRRRCFSKLVCEKLYGKIQEAVISLIIQDREGKEIDRNLIKAVLRFFMELRGEGTTDYYSKFEVILLAETSAYYSEMSMECWFWRDSFVNYLRKVDWCLVQEEARAEIYPRESTKAKILEVMKYTFLERTAKKWTQKQKDGGVAAEDEELLSKYASLSLGDGGNSADAALASDK